MTNTLILSIDLPTAIFVIFEQSLGLKLFENTNIFLRGSYKCTVNKVFASFIVIISVYLSLFKSAKAYKWDPTSPSKALKPTSTSYKPNRKNLIKCLNKVL